MLNALPGGQEPPRGAPGPACESGPGEFLGARVSRAGSQATPRSGRHRRRQRRHGLAEEQTGLAMITVFELPLPRPGYDRPAAGLWFSSGAMPKSSSPGIRHAAAWR